MGLVGEINLRFVSPKMRTFLMMVLSVAVCSNSYVNPLKGDLGVHDPVMIKEGNTYRIYQTGGTIGSKTSTDRITWRFASSGLTAPSWIKTYVPDNSGRDFWAPDISFRDNKYWLYYSVSTFGKNTSAIGLATSPTLANPTWTDQGMVIRSVSSNNYNCIDPNAFQDTDGKTYLTFGSWWTGIKMVEVDPATGKPASESPAIISLASHSGGIEGPFLFKWGYYYLFVSWDKCCEGCNSTYKIVAGRSTSVKGPFVDKSGKAMTAGGGEILDAGDAVRKGPGHNGIFIERDSVFCVNHYYACNSILQIRPLYFDGGWPSFTGTQTSPPLVDVKQAARVLAPRQSSKVTVVFGPSRTAPVKGRVFSISGKEIRGQRASSGQLSQGIFIIDSR
ncbi:MAG: arabinan endo-1,5-alpha-L-arabinosidase [Chitinispirillaceae bacterium]|nr:arabinan endo-1,5-alpha-L-arabinosidase [Chitinispirillaceae bacterium]